MSDEFEYIRSFRGYPPKPGPWHTVPRVVEGYARAFWKNTALCGTNPHVHGWSNNQTRDEIPEGDKQCAKCKRLESLPSVTPKEDKP